VPPMQRLARLHPPLHFWGASAADVREQSAVQRIKQKDVMEMVFNPRCVCKVNAIGIGAFAIQLSDRLGRTALRGEVS